MEKNGQLFYSFLLSVKLTELKWSESFWTIQVQCVVNLFLLSSFRQTGLGSNFKLRNKPRPLYSVIVCGLWVFLVKLKSFKTNQSLHIIWERFTPTNAYRTKNKAWVTTKNLSHSHMCFAASARNKFITLLSCRTLCSKYDLSSTIFVL